MADGRKPWERLHPADLAELRQAMLKAIREEVRIAIAEGREGTLDTPGTYCTCDDGWRRCMMCDGGRMPTWTAGRGWTTCRTCADSGRDGWLRCKQCANPGSDF